MTQATHSSAKKTSPLQQAYLWSRGKPLSAEELAAFGKPPKQKSGCSLFVDIIDCNNANERDHKDCNRPMPAILVGVKGIF